MITPAISAASSGIYRNLAIFEEAATRIAEGPIDTNTIRDISEMKLAQTGVAVNVAVLRMSNDMAGQFIDLFA